MKINIDTEDFITTRKIAWVLLWIASVILIFHLGVWAGYCKAFRHHAREMHGQQYFNQDTSGHDWDMPGDSRDVMYYDQGDVGGQRVIYFR